MGHGSHGTWVSSLMGQTGHAWVTKCDQLSAVTVSWLSEQQSEKTLTPCPIGSHSCGWFRIYTV